MDACKVRVSAPVQVPAPRRAHRNCFAKTEAWRDFGRVGFTREVENLIASLRGLPENRSRSIPRESRSLQSLIPKLLEDHLASSESLEEQIAKEWETIIGSANAAYARPLRVESKSRLFVAVSNNVIRQELFFHRKLILERVRNLPGCSTIREVVLRTG